MTGTAIIYQPVGVNEYVFPQSTTIPANILLAPKTKGLVQLFSSRDIRTNLVLWRRQGNISVRVLSDEELQRFLAHYDLYSWRHHTRIYKIDARLQWIIARGKLRKPVKLTLF